jgi:hypothetical protein
MYRRDFSSHWSSDPTDFADKSKQFEPEPVDSGYLSGALDSSDNAASSSKDDDVIDRGLCSLLAGPTRSFSSPSSFGLYGGCEKFFEAGGADDLGDSGLIDVTDDACCSGVVSSTSSDVGDELVEEAFGVDENGDTALHEAIMNVRTNQITLFFFFFFFFCALVDVMNVFVRHKLATD